MGVSIYPYGGFENAKDSISSLDVVVRESLRFDFYTVIIKSNRDLSKYDVYKVYFDSDSGFAEIFSKK